MQLPSQPHTAACSLPSPTPAGAQGLPGPPQTPPGGCRAEELENLCQGPHPRPGGGEELRVPPTWADPAEASPAPLTLWHPHPTPRQ